MLGVVELRNSVCRCVYACAVSESGTYLHAVAKQKIWWSLRFSEEVVTLKEHEQKNEKDLIKTKGVRRYELAKRVNPIPLPINKT